MKNMFKNSVVALSLVASMAGQSLLATPEQAKVAAKAVAAAAVKNFDDVVKFADAYKGKADDTAQKGLFGLGKQPGNGPSFETLFRFGIAEDGLKKENKGKIEAIAADASSPDKDLAKDFLAAVDKKDKMVFVRALAEKKPAGFPRLDLNGALGVFDLKKASKEDAKAFLDEFEKAKKEAGDGAAAAAKFAFIEEGLLKEVLDKLRNKVGVKAASAGGSGTDAGSGSGDDPSSSSSTDGADKDKDDKDKEKKEGIPFFSANMKSGGVRMGIGLGVVGALASLVGAETAVDKIWPDLDEETREERIKYVKIAAGVVAACCVGLGVYSRLK